MLWFGDDERDGPDRRAHESAEEKEPRRIGEQIWTAGPQRQRERERERERVHWHGRAADVSGPHVGVSFEGWATRVRWGGGPQRWFRPIARFCNSFLLFSFSFFLFSYLYFYSDLI